MKHRKEFLPFEQARAFVQGLGLKNQKEWKAYCQSGQKPSTIPTNPNRTYSQDFQGYGDWLGSGFIAPRNREYRSFEQAQTFVQTLMIKSTAEWREYCQSGKKPHDIPRTPDIIYKQDWHGWGDWLGTGTIAPFNREFLPFEEARNFVHALGLKGVGEWRAYCLLGKKPDTISTHPDRTYKSDFQGWGDWLGTGTIAPFNREFLPFEEARVFARTLGLKNYLEWRAYCRSGDRPDTIPSSPRITYPDEFQGWHDWLGTRPSNVNTTIERLVASQLDKIGMVYVRQKRIGNYHVDFWIADWNLLLECDGCYFHSCLQCGFDNPTKRGYDRIRTNFFEKHGYRVVHLWEHAIRANVEEAVASAFTQLL
jgi:very-short-patch-repair endonuclease